MAKKPANTTIHVSASTIRLADRMLGKMLIEGRTVDGRRPNRSLLIDKAVRMFAAHVAMQATAEESDDE